MKQVDDLAPRPGKARVEVRDVADVSRLPVESDTPAPDLSDDSLRLIVGVVVNDLDLHGIGARILGQDAPQRFAEIARAPIGREHHRPAGTLAPVLRHRRHGIPPRGRNPGHQRATDARASLAPSLSMSRGETVLSEAASEEAAPKAGPGKRQIPLRQVSLRPVEEISRASATGGRREARTPDPGEATVEALDRRVLGGRRLARELPSLMQPIHSRHLVLERELSLHGAKRVEGPVRDGKEVGIPIRNAPDAVSPQHSGAGRKRIPLHQAGERPGTRCIGRRPASVSQVIADRHPRIVKDGRAGRGQLKKVRLPLQFVRVAPPIIPVQ